MPMELWPARTFAILKATYPLHPKSAFPIDHLRATYPRSLCRFLLTVSLIPRQDQLYAFPVPRGRPCVSEHLLEFGALAFGQG